MGLWVYTHKVLETFVYTFVASIYKEEVLVIHSVQSDLNWSDLFGYYKFWKMKIALSLLFIASLTIIPSLITSKDISLDETNKHQSSYQYLLEELDGTHLRIAASHVS